MNRKVCERLKGTLGVSCIKSEAFYFAPLREIAYLLEDQALPLLPFAIKDKVEAIHADGG